MPYASRLKYNRLWKSIRENSVLACNIAPALITIICRKRKNSKQPSRRLKCVHSRHTVRKSCIQTGSEGAYYVGSIEIFMVCFYDLILSSNAEQCFLSMPTFVFMAFFFIFTKLLTGSWEPVLFVIYSSLMIITTTLRG